MLNEVTFPGATRASLTQSESSASAAADEGPQVRHTPQCAMPRLEDLSKQLKKLSQWWSPDKNGDKGLVKLPGRQEFEVPVITHAETNQPLVILDNKAWPLVPTAMERGMQAYEIASLSGVDGTQAETAKRTGSPSNETRQKRMRLSDSAAPSSATGSAPGAQTRVKRPTRIHPDERAKSVPRTEYPLRLENGAGSTSAAHALNQAFQAPVVSAASLPRASLEQTKALITQHTGLEVKHHLITDAGDEEAHNKLCRDFQRTCVAIVKLGGPREAGDDGDHLVTLVRVADGQDEIDAGVWLLDSSMDAPIRFDDAQAALDAIKRRQGAPLLSVLVPKQALPPVLGGAQSVYVQHHGLVLSRNLGDNSRLMRQARAAWGLDVSDLDRTGGSMPDDEPAHGDPEAWIAQLAEAPPGEPQASDDAQSWWLGGYLGGLLPVTDALRQAIRTPAPGMPLVTHYARALSQHCYIHPHASSFDAGRSEQLQAFADDFAGDALLVTYRPQSDDGTMPQEVTVLVQRRDHALHVVGHDGTSTPVPGSSLSQWLLGLMQRADAQGLGLLHPPPTTMQWFDLAHDPASSGSLDARHKGVPQLLADHLENTGFAVSDLDVTGYLTGPADEELERVLMSLCMRGAIVDAQLRQDILAQLRDNERARDGLRDRHDTHVQAWRQAKVAHANAAKSEVGTCKTQMKEAAQQVMNTRKDMAVGRHAQLVELLNRAANSQGNLPLDLNEFTLLLPSHVSHAPLNGLVHLPDKKDRTNQSRESRIRQMPTFVLQHSPCLANADWSNAAYTAGMTGSPDRLPRFLLNKELLGRFAQTLTTGDALKSRKAPEDYRVAAVLLRHLEERAAPMSPNPLDQDDALVHVENLLPVLLTPNDIMIINNRRHGFLKWLHENLDRVRDEVRAAAPGTLTGGAGAPQLPLELPPGSAKLSDIDRQHLEDALHVARLLDEEGLLPGQRTVAQMGLKALAALMKNLDGMLLDDDLLDDATLPQGMLWRTMRAMDLDPDGKTYEQRRTELLQLAPEDRRLDYSRFLLLPSPIQRQIVIREKNSANLRAALHQFCGLRLDSSKIGHDFVPRIQEHHDLLQNVQSDQTVRLVRRAVAVVEARRTIDDDATLFDAVLDPEGAGAGVLTYVRAVMKGDGTEWNSVKSTVRKAAPRVDRAQPRLPHNVDMLRRFTESLPEQQKQPGREAVRCWIRTEEHAMEDLECVNPVVVALQMPDDMSPEQAEAQFLAQARQTMAESGQEPLSTEEQRHLAAFYRLMNA